MSKKNELYDVALVVHHETDRAWLVSEDGNPESTVWIPKSQAEKYDQIGNHKFWQIFQFSMPQWLAEEKGLV